MLELRILLHQDTGNVEVSGPLAQRMLCYGLLEMAKEIIANQGQAPQPQSSIVVPKLVGPH